MRASGPLLKDGSQAIHSCEDWPSVFTRQNEEETLQPALVEIEEALVPALIVEELEDGSYTVLVPSAPTPMAGSVYILPRDRVHPVDISFAKAIGVFLKWGTGGR